MKGQGRGDEGGGDKEVKNTLICESEKRRNTVGQTNGQTDRRTNTDRPSERAAWTHLNLLKKDECFR